MKHHRLHHLGVHHPHHVHHQHHHKHPHHAALHGHWHEGTPHHVAKKHQGGKGLSPMYGKESA